MATSIASPLLSPLMIGINVDRADSHTDEIEHGALDLYDAHGWFLDRIALAGQRQTIFIDLRQLMPRLLASPCACLILRHRHPSGLAAPSQADIATTRIFADMLRFFDIRLHDHFIEGSGQSFSFRAEGLI